MGGVGVGVDMDLGEEDVRADSMKMRVDDTPSP